MYYPVHCDNICKGCSQNKCGWCIWKDRATPEYRTKAFKKETHSFPYFGDDTNCITDGIIESKNKKDE